jgi:protocatechuate 3,4-dioxygenase beta subunit
MKPLLLLITLLTAQTAPQVPNPLNNGTVEGNVIWASQSRPLEGIAVYLRRDMENVQDAQRRGVAVTDSTGHFLLKDIPPGEYIVITDRRGYFRETETDIRIAVAPRATVKDIVIRMIVGGNIIGRTLDVNGVPLAGVNVSATQPSYSAGSGKRDLLSQGGSAGSDDRGDYRIRGVRPGVYYVRADVGFWASDSMVYYPGVKDPASAVPITVREAQDTTINFRVEARLKPIMTISGRVVSPFTGVPAKPIERILISTKNDGSTYYDNRAEDRSDGRFEIRNIFPDNYDLYPDARDADGRFYTSRTNVDVIDRSIENLTLPALAPVDIRGGVMLNGEPLAGRIDNLGVRLQAVRGLDSFLVNMNSGIQNFANGDAVDRQTGEFTIPRVAPGIYRVAPARMPPTPDTYVEDVLQGITSVYKDGFEVGDRPPEPIQILLASPGARVEGVVRNLQQEPAVRVRIVLVPDASRRQDPTRYREALTDKDGKFAFRGIPPGTYKAYAWETVPNSAWFNSDFMQKYESRGQPVTLDRGATVALQLSVIPREPDPQ